MARFIFKLEGVLRQRELAEQQCQRDLAAAQAQANRLARQLHQITLQLREAQATLREMLLGHIDIVALRSHLDFIASCRGQARLLRNQSHSQNQQVELARAALTNASRQTKVMRKLREHREQEWLRGQQRQAQAEVDHVSMQMSWQDLRNDH